MRLRNVKSKGFLDFFFLCTILFNTALSAAPQIPLCRRTLRVFHWLSDALTTRLDLIQGKSRCGTGTNSGVDLYFIRKSLER
jgi:hypothetical protein